MREKVRNEISRHCNKNKLRREREREREIERERERLSSGYFSRELRMSSPPFLTRSVFYERAT
jgi:predicted O-linked N-acetylglucosamine transferase (SPINDLY family)